MSLMSFSPVSRWLASPLFGLLLVVFTEVEAASLLCGGVKQTQDEDKRGRSRMIGSSQQIVSALGEDIILPCHVEPQLNVENLTVEWWKPDKQFDPEDPLINYRYVHIYNENRDEEDMKMLRYKGRTALNKDGLKHGDISFKIMNVRQSDQGRYRCEIPKLASPSVIMLVVVKSWTTETPLAPTVNHQTPDPNDGSDVEGDGTVVKGGWIDLIVMISFLVLILGVAGYLLRHKLYGVCRRLNRTSSSLGSFPRVTFNGAQRVQPATSGPTGSAA